nr:DNA-binding response regulator [Micromonospora sp. DSM 115978]
MSEGITVAAVDDHPIVLHGLNGILEGEADIKLVATAATIDELLGGPGRGADVVLLDLDLGQGSDADTELNIHRLLDAGSAV